MFGFADRIESRGSQSARTEKRIRRGTDQSGTGRFWRSGGGVVFISEPAGSSNGRTPDSESGNLGSTPSPAGSERSKNKFGGVKQDA